NPKLRRRPGLVRNCARGPGPITPGRSLARTRSQEVFPRYMHHGSLLDRAVWVPAFAGTTAWGPADSRVLHRHLLTQIRHRRLKPALAVRDLQRVEADLDHPERAEQHRRVDMAHMGDAEGLAGEVAD